MFMKIEYFFNISSKSVSDSIIFKKSINELNTSSFNIFLNIDIKYSDVATDVNPGIYIMKDENNTVI